MSGRALTTRPQPAPEDPRVELCAFRVGDEEYAIDLRRIREIVQPLPITPVPRASAVFEGVVNLRGEVLPLVDVRKRLGLAPGAGSRPKILVVRVADRVLGLLVDGVLEVVRTTRAALGPAPLGAGTGRSALFLGVCGAREGRPPQAARPPASPRAPAPGRPPSRLRLLLNVKALLLPDAPARALAARALSGGEGGAP